MNRRSGRGLVTLLHPSVKDMDNQTMMYFYKGDIMLDFHGIVGGHVVRVLNPEGAKEVWIPLSNVASIVWDDFATVNQMNARAAASTSDSKGQTE